VGQCPAKCPDIRPPEIEIEIEIEKKTNSNPNSSEFDFDGFSKEEIEVITEWLKYKKEKKQSYKPTGLKQLRKRMLELKDRNILVKTISYSMTQNYNGIFEPSDLNGRAVVKEYEEQVYLPKFSN